MRTFRNAIAAAALAALLALPFVGGAVTPVANGQAPAAKVAYAPVPGGVYNIDPAHSFIGFAVRHLEINWVEGRFKDFKGTINYDGKDVTKSSVEFTAKVASVDTEVEARDKHLRTADFFDAGACAPAARVKESPTKDATRRAASAAAKIAFLKFFICLSCKCVDL